MSNSLNKLETVILAAMCEHCSNPDALRKQANMAMVLNRKNTGAGFFTELQVSCLDVFVEEKAIGNVFAKIEGCKNPVAFVLFLKNGRIKTLEGAAVEDSTIGLDFSSISFEVM